MVFIFIKLNILFQKIIKSSTYYEAYAKRIKDFLL